MLNITVEIKDGEKVHRRGFNANNRSTVLSSARYWAARVFKTAGPAATLKVTGAADFVDFVDFHYATQIAEGPESPEDCEDDRCEPPTCGMCDGVHGGSYCPLEDTGWMQSFEPYWAQ